MMTGNKVNVERSVSGVGEGGTEWCRVTGARRALCEEADVGKVGGTGEVGGGVRNSNDNRNGYGIQQPVQKQTPYDGYTPWDAYRTQFQLLAGVNG